VAIDAKKAGARLWRLFTCPLNRSQWGLFCLLTYTRSHGCVCMLHFYICSRRDTTRDKTQNDNTKTLGIVRYCHFAFCRAWCRVVNRYRYRNRNAAYCIPHTPRKTPEQRKCMHSVFMGCRYVLRVYTYYTCATCTCCMLCSIGWFLVGMRWYVYSIYICICICIYVVYSYSIHILFIHI